MKGFLGDVLIGVVQLNGEAERAVFLDSGAHEETTCMRDQMSYEHLLDFRLVRVRDSSSNIHIITLCLAPEVQTSHIKCLWVMQQVDESLGAIPRKEMFNILINK